MSNAERSLQSLDSLPPSVMLKTEERSNQASRRSHRNSYLVCTGTFEGYYVHPLHMILPVVRVPVRGTPSVSICRISRPSFEKEFDKTCTTST